MTPTPQPQGWQCDCCLSHCKITSDELTQPNCGCLFNSDIGAIWTIRSRPTPSPKTWESCREHFTCLNGEECWFLSEDYWRDQIQQAAVQARNATLDEIERQTNSIFCPPFAVSCPFDKVIRSLRTPNTPKEQQR